MPHESFYDRANNEMTFTEIRDLCLRSYEDLERGNVSIAGQSMSVEHGCTEGSFAAFTIQKRNGWRAVVFRGSDDWGDWAFTNSHTMAAGMPILWAPAAAIQVASKIIPPVQYSTGRRYVKQQGEKHVILVGHSLGGGIATYVAAEEGMDAVTIFPAPIHPLWLGLFFWSGPERGTRIQNYVSGGEILTELAHGTSLKRYGLDVWLASRGRTPFEKHSLGNIIFDGHVSSPLTPAPK